MKAISIIICCYNSEKRIINTLTALSNQKIDNHTSLEIILVNNNSTDETIKVAKNHWEKLGNPFLLKNVNEERAGLTFAREKGIEESNGSIIIFCDDDNSFNPEYVSHVLKKFDSDYSKEIGIIGGFGIEKTEIDEVPDWFYKVKNKYAVGSPLEKSGYVTNVFGAGMAFRRSVYNEIKFSGFKHQLTDRKGTSLVSGGDTEICFAAILLGYKIWWDIDNIFLHIIPSSRITKKYIARMFSASGKTAAVLTGINFIVTGNSNFKIKKRFQDDSINTLRKIKRAIINNEWFLLYLWCLEKMNFWTYYIINKKNIDSSYQKSFWFNQSIK